MKKKSIFNHKAIQRMKSCPSTTPIQEGLTFQSALSRGRHRGDTRIYNNNRYQTPQKEARVGPALVLIL